MVTRHSTTPLTVCCVSVSDTVSAPTADVVQRQIDEAIGRLKEEFSSLVESARDAVVKQQMGSSDFRQRVSQVQHVDEYLGKQLAHYSEFNNLALDHHWRNWYRQLPDVREERWDKLHLDFVKDIWDQMPPIAMKELWDALPPEAVQKAQGKLPPETVEMWDAPPPAAEALMKAWDKLPAEAVKEMWDKLPPGYVKEMWASLPPESINVVLDNL